MGPCHGQHDRRDKSAASNVISGNAAYGIGIANAGANANLVEGNDIGTNASGTGAIGNGLAGVIVESSASHNTVGGTTSGSRNVISGNVGDGIDIANEGTSDDVVLGNYIGTDITGAAALGNTLTASTSATMPQTSPSVEQPRGRAI